MLSSGSLIASRFQTTRRATILQLRFVLLAQAAVLLLFCSIRCAALNDEERASIVQLHNQIRNSVAMGKEKKWPAASDMLQMSYSLHLEELAKTHLSNCVFEPGCIGCHIGLDDRPGQNLYAMTGPANWSRAVNFWGEAPIDFVPPSEPGHPVRMRVSVLSQLLWSKSNKVGCAWKDCTSKTGNNMYLCNYMPAGNEMGGHVYMSGRPCSRCPKDTCCSHLCPHKTQPAYEGLCAPK
ncbi:venom allergen 5-like isoform X2 [Dermacentor variabilis]|uniref:venom allergen 5-like isoform X2 n=1 Tax=Dermacentor variabilis TaxID=34621 RepID=UPI003F5C8A81